MAPGRKRDLGDWLDLALGVAIGFSIHATIDDLTGREYRDGLYSIQREAVLRGCGEWYHEDGAKEAEFRWLYSLEGEDE